MSIKVRTDNEWINVTSPGPTFVTGMIMMFSGTTAPTGWALCNGQTVGSSTTPDLRDRFIVGAGSVYAVGDTGGSPNAVLIAHTHSVTTTIYPNPHVHPVTTNRSGSTASGSGDDGGADLGESTGNAWLSATTTIIPKGINAAGGNSPSQTGTNANLPPYYALAFIMKI